MSRIANYESKIQNFLIADEEHLGMAGFDMARLAPFYHVRAKTWRMRSIGTEGDGKGLQSAQTVSKHSDVAECFDTVWAITGPMVVFPSHC